MFDKLNTSAYKCKKERSVPFKICQNAFPAGWAYYASPDPLVGLAADILPPSVWKAAVFVPCNLQRVVIILQRVVDINQWSHIFYNAL